MIFQRTYRRRIFLSFFAVFSIFTIAVFIYQFDREKEYRIGQLENKLDNISETAHQYIEHYHIFENKNFHLLDSLKNILPLSNTRLTIIDPKGVVMYDSFVSDYEYMENHLQRPEVQKSIYSGKGSSIRRSATTSQDFYYYSRYYQNYFIRTAVVYNIEVRKFLKTEHIFIVFIVFLFSLMWLILHLITRRLSDFITKLKDFAVKAGRDEDISLNTKFQDNELGVIRKQIITIYNNLKKAKDDLTLEHEKLYNHLNVLNEGIAIFNANREKILANSHFIQFINVVSDQSTITAENIFSIPEFQKVFEFTDKYIHSKEPITSKNLPQFECTISKGETYFQVKSIVFADRSFEILISDISRLEKRRLLKQQLTSNIAHELKTPLASIKGYLETLLHNHRVPEEKKRYFIEKAYGQAERLTELLNDISLLNNIEDAGELFEIKPVTVRTVINEVIENLASRLEENKINCVIDVDESVRVNGNESLLFSVFQNFMENTIRYAGKGVTVTIRKYHEDEKFCYFSYADNGTGIPEEHLPRIFERFYRIDHGRTRETGGTGLGLSIVKNAIQLHKGEISARNHPKGGLEFLFSLAK